MLESESLKVLRQIRTALVVLAASGCVIAFAVTLPLLVKLFEWIGSDVGRTAFAVGVGVIAAIAVCGALLANLAEPSRIPSDAI